jgi:acyl-CoA oxidase
MDAIALNRTQHLHRHLTGGSDWESDWLKATDEVLSDISFEESADRLRALIQTGLLTYYDIRDNPERFFQAHKLLARHAVEHGPGFWIRFTVQYNLFAGTVLAVGGVEQVAALKNMQAAGSLGCFGLTEKLAGVQSGLVVQTTAEWNEEEQQFVMNTPHPGAQKNWISQGYTADKAVVMADLRVRGKSVGPHAFLVDFRSNGSTLAGVTLGDMGRKTTGNDLDNAWINFDQVRVPKSSLLNRYADIDSNNNYVKKSKVPAFAMIGQRLYTGRVAVAQAALSYTRVLFQKTKQYADNKACWSPSAGQEPMLSGIPQLATIFEEAEAMLGELDNYVGRCELKLSECLSTERIPGPLLVEAIATAKVRAVERCIDLSFRLKQEVGSFALMGDAGFQHLDFLQCCKFAEGDSRILMQKMARDRLKQYHTLSKDGSTIESEGALCEKIAQTTKEGMEAHGDKQKAIDSTWKEIYALADLVMDRTQAQFMAS